MDTDARIENLEIKLAYQEDTIQALNDIVVKQQTKLAQLEASCDFLVSQLKDLEGISSNGGAPDEKPPHY